jgi:hypothetical protein
MRTSPLLAAVLLAAGCDAQLPSDPPVGPGPAPPHVQTKTVEAMYVYGVGEAEPAGTLLVAEADTLRGSVVFDAYAAVRTSSPCANADDGLACQTAWVRHPVASRTTVRLDVPVEVDGRAVPAGTDLLPLLGEADRASLVTPMEVRTLAMTWGTDEGPTFADETRFYFDPAP